MIYLNKKMAVLLAEEKCFDTKDIKQLCVEIVSKTRLFNDCILYDVSNPETINWDYILQINGDLIGFEASQSEIIIPDEIFCENGINIFLTELEKLFNKRFPNKRVCFILSHNGLGLLRFHTYRLDDGLWLDSDLENYQEAVLYYID